MKILLIALAAGLIGSGAGHAQSRGAPARPLAVGDLAPEFTLPGTDGRTYRLADYRGKHAVVLAWFAKAFSAG